MENIAFLFPGQGSQFIGMGKGLYDQYEVARQTFEEANDTLGFNISGLCFDGNIFELNRMENMLTSILTANMALYRIYMQEIGISPQFCAGHSLGELSALACSGVVRFSDALRIAKRRGEIAQELVDTDNYCMSIVDKADRTLIEQICRTVSSDENIASVSCYNSRTQFTISGNKAAIEKAESLLMDDNAQVTPLIMSAPFHCILMEKAAIKFKEYLKKYKFYQPKWPVISNVTGLPYQNTDEIADILSKQLFKPVQWQKIIKYTVDHGTNLMIELGTKNILGYFVKEDYPGVETFCFGQKGDREYLVNFFKNGNEYKKDIPTFIDRCLVAAVSTPNRNFDINDYKTGVIEPYRLICKIRSELDKKGLEPDEHQKLQMLELLHIILKTKKVVEIEQYKLINNIIEDSGIFISQRVHEILSELS